MAENVKDSNCIRISLGLVLYCIISCHTTLNYSRYLPLITVLEFRADTNYRNEPLMGRRVAKMIEEGGKEAILTIANKAAEEHNHSLASCCGIEPGREVHHLTKDVVPLKEITLLPVVRNHQPKILLPTPVS